MPVFTESQLRPESRADAARLHGWRAAASGHVLDGATAEERSFQRNPTEPSFSSILMIFVYFAKRSERQSDPVFIWPQLVATAKSAMEMSSISPELRHNARVSRPARHIDGGQPSAQSSVSTIVTDGMN